MSYKTIAANAQDVTFQNRLRAACAQEDRPPDESTAMWDMLWEVCSRADIEAAYASALAASNPDPGGDETVVTDGMILSAVQSIPPDA